MEKVNWRVSNIKPFINKYNWNGINYPSNILEFNQYRKSDKMST